MLATAYWATSTQGGVTQRGVVLTYLLSLVIGSQKTSPPPPPEYPSRVVSSAALTVRISFRSPKLGQGSNLLNKIKS